MLLAPSFSNVYLLHEQFANDIKSYERNYLAQPGIKRYADQKLTLHWLTALIIYLAPLVLLMALKTGLLLTVPLVILSGFGAAMLVFAIVQGGAHPPQFRHKWLSRLQLICGYFLGRPQYFWIVGHAYLHHTFTNFAEFDSGTQCFGLIRQSKSQPFKPWHRFQHYYAWLVYAFLPLIGFFSDFAQPFLYLHYDLPQKERISALAFWCDLILAKGAYMTVFILMPVMFAHIGLLHIIIVLFFIHMIAGGLIFSLAAGCHQFQGSEHLERYHGMLHAEPLAHQLCASRGFSHGSTWVTWWTAGANYHTEHHLFPYLAHVHYPAMTSAVEKIAKDKGFVYHIQPTYRGFIHSHFVYLKNLARKPAADHRYEEQFRGHYFKHKAI